MNIEKNLQAGCLRVAVSGRLDTTSSPELEAALIPLPEDVTELILDVAGLEYISSAGLRVLLILQKAMKDRGTMTILSPNEVVMEVFEVTGFHEILTIQQG